MSRVGITLIEVILAMLILATSLLPIFGLMTRTTKDSDATLTRAYAINYAKSVFSTVIDDIPFADIRHGSPAIIIGSSRNKAKALFPDAVSASGGIACNGIVKDSRGIYYRVFLKSEAIMDETDGYTNGEFYFSYYPNPEVESQPGWINLQINSHTSENTDNVPSMFSKTNPAGLKSPYRYFGDDVAAGRWGPAEEHAGNIIHVDQREISQPNPDGSFYLMQRLILQIRWNMDSAYYKQPDADKGRPVKLQIITYKANLD
ncbi:MAG: hypothetical protein PWR01_4035 [Clostridiales bacterium]|nr:hypothetical protein [Clostridiales bacterium]MDN5282962.1 hypothetical protein [Candidatus Ozemobacter sp.]